MKRILTLMIVLICASYLVKAQQYQQGDISAEFQLQMVHDSSYCASIIAYSLFQVTISNSFVGDTLLVKEFNYPYYVTSIQVNTTGQNPWILNLPLNYYTYSPSQNVGPNPLGFINDIFIDPAMGSMATIQTLSYKLINGQDSIADCWGQTGLYVPDPCSYSTISGASYADYNSNCVFDVTDGTFSNYQVNLSHSYSPDFMIFGGLGPVFSNGFSLMGQYSIDIQESFFTAGTVTYNNGMLPFAYPNGCTPGIYSFTTLPQTGIDFALQCTSNIDLAAHIGTSSPVRPGIPFTLFPHISNMGCDTVSGWVKVVLDDRVIYNPALSSNPPMLMLGDTMYWTHGPISNMSNNGFWNSFSAGLHLTPDTTVTIGDTLCFYIETSMPAADIYAGNNIKNVCMPVVNSFDPNMKEAMPKGIGAAGVIPPTQNELTYTVYFQNTGTASAINVRIIDTLDANIIPQSLVILGRSHSMTPQWLAPGVVRFSFANINLPDSTTNELLSHGFVTFSVKLDGTLPLGTEIKNKANIYFDFNAPIITNTTLNTVDILTDTKVQTVSKHISIYPNPAQNELTVSIGNFKNNSNSFVELYNVSGQLILNQTVNSTNTRLNLSSLNKGFYLLKTCVNGEVYVSKVIVE